MLTPENGADPDPLDEIVKRIMAEGGATLDAFGEGRKYGAFCAGLRSAAEDMHQPLSLSAAIALTETWMVGDTGWADDEDDDDQGDEA